MMYIIRFLFFILAILQCKLALASNYFLPWYQLSPTLNTSSSIEGVFVLENNCLYIRSDKKIFLPVFETVNTRWNAKTNEVLIADASYALNTNYHMKVGFLNHNYPAPNGLTVNNYTNNLISFPKSCSLNFPVYRILSLS